MKEILFLLVLVLLGEMGIMLLLWRMMSRKAEKPAEKPAEVKKEPRKGSIDEGFENIMRFSVKGKTGFEQTEYEE